MRVNRAAAVRPPAAPGAVCHALYFLSGTRVLPLSKAVVSCRID